MVKNQFGGSSHKKFARKNVTTNDNKKQLRTAKLEGEVYAKVIKMYGGGMCGVVDMNGKEYICIIRGKFSGKDKKNNLVEMGSWVLIGLREWEREVADKKPKCDLLEIYTSEEFTRLKNMVRGNWGTEDDNSATSNSISESKNSTSSSSSTPTPTPQFVFKTNEDEFEYEALMSKVNATASTKTESNTDNKKSRFYDDDNDFNIDDI